VQGVFTRIRSGATVVASYGGVLGSTTSQRRQCVLVAISSPICWEWLRMRGVKNPKGFGFYLLVNSGPSNGRMDKSALGCLSGGA
jgi:hypothetical protein